LNNTGQPYKGWREALIAFAKAPQDGLRLNEFTLTAINDRASLDEQYIRNLASIVARSEVRRLEIELEEDERVWILESIQWNHIRELTVGLRRKNQFMSAIRALVDGMEETTSGRVELEYFKLYLGIFRGSISDEESDVLQSFLSLTMLKHLELTMTMNPVQVVGLLKSVDVSRLQQLGLWTKGFDSTDVQTILDGLQHSTELQAVRLFEANIKMEQREDMRTKGVTLIN
jgi:hypothetical protein